MQVIINISDEIVAEAQSRGLPVEKYIEEVLLHQTPGERAARQLHSSEDIQSWLDSLAQYSEKIPPLPNVISREWLYQDHN